MKGKKAKLSRVKIQLDNKLMKAHNMLDTLHRVVYCRTGALNTVELYCLARQLVVEPRVDKRKRR